MKKTFLTLTAVFISVAAWGQGIVTLNNRVTGVVDARVLMPDGSGAGAGWTAQLYGGPAGTAVDKLVPLFPTTTFRTSSAAAQGYVNAVDVTVPGVRPGSQATLVMRVFNGADFETSTSRGQSSPMTITLGGGSLPPANLAGLQWGFIGWLQPVITTPPVITAQPITQNLAAGDRITFSVTATGTVPLRYQWYKDNVLVAGATNATLTLSNASNADVASYYVVVSNAAGAVTSTTAYLSAAGTGSGGTTLLATRLEIEPGPTLKLTGIAGTTNQILYVTDLGVTNKWLVLTNIVLSNLPSFFLDASREQKRFYRAAVSTGSPSTSIQANPDPARLVWIQPGTFTMGSPVTELDRLDWESPQRVVTLTKGFWMGKYEVTQGEYQTAMGTNPSTFKGDRNPVETVGWNDAVAYCVRLTERERAVGRLPSGYVYRLPTEAEWEYACRAGTTTAFHYGNDLRSGMAKFNGHYEYVGGTGTVYNPNGIYLIGTTAVGSYQANALGLYDMHGNVGEWCLDWYGSYYPYPGGIVTDPQGAPAGSERMIRGGSWCGDAQGCRSAARYRESPSYRQFNWGFRVVLAPGQP